MENKPEQTKFFGGMDYLKRIHEDLEKLNFCTIEKEDFIVNKNDRMVFWNRYLGALRVLYKELRLKMGKGMKEEHDGIMKEIDSFWESVSNDFIKGKPIASMELRQLDKWEMLLRDFAEAKGLIMPNQDSETDIEDEE